MNYNACSNISTGLKKPRRIDRRRRPNRSDGLSVNDFSDYNPAGAAEKFVCLFFQRGADDDKQSIRDSAGARRGARFSLTRFGATRWGLAMLSAVACNLTAPTAWSADNYAIDPAHTAVNFKIAHMGLSWTYGRFNDVSGKFTIDPEAPGKTTFALSIKPESIDTGNAKRDEHLRSPDFLNAKQFATIGFSGARVKPIEGGYEVQGDFTLHGVTKPIAFVLKGGKTAEFPPGMQRTGFSTELVLRRSDFGMDKMLEAVGDEIKVAISFEGVKK